ncbi:BspA family leucine-rich repeat surface protein [Segatella copri]|uniref:BspA family leucine-rich repeat surface protein n=1 Tax=Segatella copri TaxID=165179 RepID=UPI002FF2B8C5
MGGAIIRRFALFPLMLLMLLLLPAGMVAQKAASSSKYIATYESSTQTLTFKKNVGETLPKNSAWVIEKKSVAFINKNIGNGTIVHIVFDKSFSTYTPTSLSRFFKDLPKLETITGLEYLNTEKVTDMSYMFSGCTNLTSLDVTKFNTANVTNMSDMFGNCSALTSLDVSKFNTVNVTNMGRMFYNCSALISLDVTNFNTEKVTYMVYMFSGCSKLTSLDASKFNTVNVTNMGRMFSNCSALTSLDVTNFNTKKVTNMGRMFFECQALTTIYASSKFVTTQVSKSSDMFYNCKKLKGEEEWKNDKAIDKTYAKIDGGYFRDKAYDNRPWVKFADGTLTFRCGYKKTLGENEYELNSGKNQPKWNTPNNNINLVVFDASFANARPTTCSKWFQGFENLKQIKGIENLNTANVTDMSYMFKNCSNLAKLDVTHFNTAKVTTMLGMFNACSNLTELDVTHFNTAKVTIMNGMFSGCSNLTELDLTHFNTANVTNMYDMFFGCKSLTTIYVSDEFVITNITIKTYSLFFDCIKLKGAIGYNKSETNYKFANYKTGYFTKLVGKNGDEKIGAAGKTLVTDNLTLADDKDFVAYEPFAAKAASYSRPVKEGTTWATLCLPFEVSLDGQNFRAFKLLSADDVTETVELEEIEGSIEAGTPVIIKMNDGATELKFTEADKEIAKDVQTAETADANYKLQGIYTKKEFSKDTDNNCYIVKGSKLMNPAKLLDKTATKSVGSKPFRAYMVDNSSAPAAGARMFSISVGGSTTAIEQLETTADSKAEYYDLQGRRLQDLQKGINIVKRGGKTMKVIIK